MSKIKLCEHNFVKQYNPASSDYRVCSKCGGTITKAEKTTNKLRDIWHNINNNPRTSNYIYWKEWEKIEQAIEAYIAERENTLLNEFINKAEGLVGKQIKREKLDKLIHVDDLIDQLKSNEGSNE